MISMTNMQISFSKITVCQLLFAMTFGTNMIKLEVTVSLKYHNSVSVHIHLLIKRGI